MTGSTIRLKHLQIFRNAKSGLKYAYFRKGNVRIRIKSEPGTPEFIREYEAAERKANKKAEAPGTLGLAICEYKTTRHFAEDLEPVTRREYLRYIKHLERAADMPLREIVPAWIADLRNKYDKGHGFRSANMLLTVLRRILENARENGHVDHNFADGIANAKRPKRLKKQNRPWEPEEVAAVMDAAPPQLRIVIALCRATGLRIGDAIRVQRSGQRDGWLQWRTSKRDVWAYLPIRGWLAAELARAPQHNAITILATSSGRPWASSDSVGGGIRKLFGRLVAEGKVQPGLTIHGLRHTVGHELADAGCTDEEIAAWLAHTSTATAKIYTEGAKRKRSMRRAVARLEGEQ